ncbi:GNAT family N-acetyltransferase [Halomarina rubra]|uniref:GNAT family N-acetyltransferase n=1 Tax=Halomarina rubra TaxID=2071873 RepID=A0ABD6ASA8_9EURY|nr:GNAT family N-acetyltransferase [Halomarina rubra]
MNVREATAADSEAVRRVHSESIRGLGVDAYTQQQVDAWAAGCESADYSGAIASDGLYYVVAEDGDEITGFGSLSIDVEGNEGTMETAEVTAVYVRPTAARRGVGSSLYAALERRARTLGVDRLELSASLTAVAFYESHGFEREGTSTHEFSGHEGTEVEGTVVEMSKRL